MNLVPLDIGGTLRWRAPERATGTPTVIVYGPSGDVRVASASATLDSVNTTISGAAQAGQRTFNVASSASVTVGDRYLVGPNDGGQTEFVTIDSVPASGVIQTQHPLLYSYTTGDAFVGTYLSVSISAAVVDTPGKNWRAEFTWATADGNQPNGMLRFDVVRHWVNWVPCTMDDLRLLDPKVTERVAATFDHDRNMQLALYDVIRDVNTSLDAEGVLDVGDDEWAELVALRAIVRVSHSMGPSGPGVAYRELWETRYRERLDILKGQLVLDTDQDGDPEPHEQALLGGRFYRA